jgi:hypothetical protein
MSEWEEGELEFFDSKMIVVHEPGTFKDIEELCDKVVLAVTNIMSGQVWLIPLRPEHAAKVGADLIAYSSAPTTNK